MGAIRTVGAVVAVAGSRTPVYTGAVIAAETFSIKNGIATIVLGPGNLPQNGYNGPNGVPTKNGTTGSAFDIHGPNSGMGQQVTLWAFATATYFNGCTITVLDCDQVAGSFRFAFAHANVASTSDAGNTAAIPVQHYRAVRLEVGAAIGSDFIYVGDLNVSATRYMTALSATNPSITISSDNIPADRVFIDTDGTSPDDNVQVTLIY